jgi:hypothetical protein
VRVAGDEGKIVAIRKLGRRNFCSVALTRASTGHNAAQGFGAKFDVGLGHVRQEQFAARRVHFFLLANSASPKLI